MNLPTRSPRLVGASSRRLALIIVMAGLSVLAGLVSIFAFGGYRVNVTPSFPLGLWQIVPITGDVKVGETVLICLPIKGAVFQLGWQRGYFPRGLCKSGVAPLIKTVVAVSGQIISIHNEKVFIDGHALAHSTILTHDGRGRPMVPYAGGVIPPHSVFLHSDYLSSYDSRYFGPVPAEGILGQAALVFAF